MHIRCILYYVMLSLQSADLAGGAIRTKATPSTVSIIIISISIIIVIISSSSSSSSSNSSLPPFRARRIPEPLARRQACMDARRSRASTRAQAQAGMDAGTRGCSIIYTQVYNYMYTICMGQLSPGRSPSCLGLPHLATGNTYTYTYTSAPIFTVWINLVNPGG